MGDGFCFCDTGKRLLLRKGDTANDTKDMSESVLGAKKYADNAVSELKGAATKTVKELRRWTCNFKWATLPTGSVDRRLKMQLLVWLAEVSEEGLLSSVAQANGKVSAVKEKPLLRC